MNNNVVDVFSQLKIENVVVMPDSLNSIIIKQLLVSDTVKVIQGLNEVDVIAICSGLNLTGSLSVAMMENSGIRTIADILTRFELSHHIHNIFILSSRGGIGEDNWWGINHKRVTETILSDLGISIVEVNTLKELKSALIKCVRSFKTDQMSVVISITLDFFRSLT